MTDRFIRAMKGVFMGAMFALFFMGLLSVLFFAVPVVWVLNRLLEEKPRLQQVLVFSFRFWLWLLGLLGLLKSRPAKGSPSEGPCVVICNHPGLFDVLFLIRDIPNLSVFVKFSLSRSLPLGPILRACGYILAPDYNSVSPLDSAEEALKKIEGGAKVQLFPEGTRSPAGGLRSFKLGAFKIARMTNVPLQPVLIRNDPPFLPKEDKWYYPPRETSWLQLEFWEPIPPPGKGEEKALARELEWRYRQALGYEASE